MESGSGTWENADAVLGPTVVHVTAKDVYLYRVEPARCVEVAGQLRAGADPKRFVGDGTKQLSFLTLTQIRANKRDTDVYFMSGSRESADVILRSPGARDELLEHLRRSLRGPWREHEDAYSKARGGLPGLLGASFFTMMTVLLCLGAVGLRAGETVRVSGRRQGLKKLIIWFADLLGPVGIGILGGLLVLLFLFVAYQRIKTPPIMRVLTRKPYKPEAAWKLAAKYALMLFFIFIAGRALALGSRSGPAAEPAVASASAQQLHSGNTDDSDVPEPLFKDARHYDRLDQVDEDLNRQWGEDISEADWSPHPAYRSKQRQTGGLTAEVQRCQRRLKMCELLLRACAESRLRCDARFARCRHGELTTLCGHEVWSL